MSTHTTKSKLRNLLFHILPKPTVKSSIETLDYILEKKCSISRYGDGEFGLIMASWGIYFQKPNDKLRLKLKQVLKSDLENHLVCIPYTLVDRSHLEPTDVFPFWDEFWKVNYRKLIRHLDLTKTYFDSLITRPYMDLKDKSGASLHFDKLKKIFQDQNIYIIEGESSRTGVGNDLFGNTKKISRIVCPADNAYDLYDRILNEAVKSIPKDSLILLCLGPTATVLAYDLAKIGYWAIDLGHIDMEYEWFLMAATSRTSIKNKIIREGGVVFDLADKQQDTAYTESIICRIN